ncbi:envelope glycoprotein [Saguinine gammaherpesvirus 1]|uniref:Packaging protein UL32 n=1 Tax=Saguinine gammaherpesvirus 1 TaxID=2169901 RepID=A0A9Q8VHC7_9GAMA|nr:envelope glycoprotein [Saguinine gammaherpesvirus 1]
MFLPWKSQTIRKVWPQLNHLLRLSHLPGTPESALDDPVLIHTHSSLCSASPCKICTWLFQAISSQDPPLQFFEDYALLCYFAQNAPHSWMSTFMVAADLVDLITSYFDLQESDPFFGPETFLGVDIQLHFFTNRCFQSVTHLPLIQLSDLHILKKDFIRSCLTKSQINHMCFKSLWSSIHPSKQCKGGSIPCMTTATLQHPFNIPAGENDTLLKIFRFIWAGSLLFPELPETDCPYPDMTISIPDGKDRNQGPCLLTETLSLTTKTQTHSICILCELLTCHPEAGSAIQRISNEIIYFVDNNITILDRIALYLDSPDSLNFILSPLLRETIKGCSPQTVHRHLFCDPRCAINSLKYSKELLFNSPELEKLPEFRASLATGLFLKPDNSCPILETLICIFKCIQTNRPSKTLTLDIVKELDSQLKKHKISTVSVFHTLNLYP